MCGVFRVRSRQFTPIESATLPEESKYSSIAGGRKSFAWTEDEDAELIAQPGNDSLESLSRTVGRSEGSVRRRRDKLRLEGRID